MKTTSTEKYFLFILLGIALVLATAILYPFLSVIVLSFALTITLNPIYRWVNKNITGGISWLSSIITILLFLIIVCAPMFFVGNVVFKQTQEAYFNVTQSAADTSTFIQSIDTTINKFMPAGFTFNTYEKITDLVAFISANITNFFSSTFRAGLMFFITIIALFYLLKDGEMWRQRLLDFSPMSEEHFNEISLSLKKSINHVFRGSFLIALLQGCAVGIGFTLFGVPNPALWGVVAGIASFLPILGAPMVTIPAMIFLYVTGMEFQAVGLLVWSFVFMMLIDNILGPYFIAKNSEIPSLMILLAILGGIALMGPIGVLVGPLVFSLLYSLIKIYKRHIKNGVGQENIQ